MSFGMFGLSDTYDIADAHISTGTYTSWCLTPTALKSMEQCGQTEMDMDYMTTGPWSSHLDHIPNADMCCTKCQEASDCQAWTWVKDAGLDGCPSQCWLKGGTPTNKMAKKGVVSGLPRATSREKHMYLHVVVTKAYGGRGVEPEQLCPVTTTTSTHTTSTSTHSSTTTSTATSSSTRLGMASLRKSSLKPTTAHSLLSWVGCYTHDDRSGGADQDTDARRRNPTTTACAQQCHGHKYMLLRNNSRCSCMDQHPEKARLRQVEATQCGSVCTDEAGLRPTRYCGAPSAFAVYGIEMKLVVADKNDFVDDLLVVANPRTIGGAGGDHFLSVARQ
mmetsp:Transcript_83128/g.235802  ORF Transcript_83128/g.235802 Transcript_83128/m.235802 type:complete len:333 (+) Transcript_83128:2-1000(+)